MGQVDRFHWQGIKTSVPEIKKQENKKSFLKFGFSSKKNRGLRSN